MKLAGFSAPLIPPGMFTDLFLYGLSICSLVQYLMYYINETTSRPNIAFHSQGKSLSGLKKISQNHQLIRTIKDRVHLAESQLQSHVSSLLAAYAASSFVFSPVAGAIADKTRSRQMPFLVGLVALMLATVLLFTGSSVAVLTIARIAQGASSAVSAAASWFLASLPCCSLIHACLIVVLKKINEMNRKKLVQ